MTNSILIQNVSPETLTELIKESVKSQLDDFKKDLQTHNPDELLTREEALKFLQINSSTLWHWTNKGKITAYGIGNRRYYKKAELIEALKPLKNKAMENSQYLDHSFKSISKVKDKHFQAQMKRVFQSFYRQPKTMLMVAVETGIERANICRYVATLRKQNRIHLVRNGICPISKHRAGFLTTNVEFLKPESHE